MVSPAYKACPTFVSSLHATCQLSRSCTTLPSSSGFSLCFSFSIPSCLFPVQVPFSTAYHFSSSSFSLSPHFLLLMSLSLYHNVRKLQRGLDKFYGFSPQVLMIRGIFHEMSIFLLALPVPFARAQPLQRT